MTAVSHPLFARLWARAAPRAAAWEDRRAAVGTGARRVVEVGAGAGTNLPLYAAGAEVVAVEPEPLLRGHAEAAAREAAADVRVVDATADALPVADGWADAVVCFLVLCTVPDQARALAEARRVLRPGGELRFYEHVAAEGGVGRRVQRGLDITGVWPRFGGGCHVARDTLTAIGAAGFAVRESRHFRVGPLPHVAGVAVAAG